MDARAEESRPRLSRSPLVWAAAVAVLVLLFGGGVVALNLTVFSASGFVTTYLQTLGSGDVSGAFDVPGVDLPKAITKGSADAALLDPAALASIHDIHIVSDLDKGDGTHRVTASYVLQGAERETKAAQTEFVVKSTGPTFAVFNGWRFAISPVATVTLQVQHTTNATVNARELRASVLGAASGAFSAQRSFPVLVPALLVARHDSHYLRSETASVAATTPGADAAVTVTAEPNEVFQHAVQSRVDDYLDSCATQKALFPSGCPFGESVSDRIVGDPAWTITGHPAVVVSAGASGWSAVSPDAAGAAHLRVDVKSIFDGTVSTLEKDVPFGVSYAVALGPDEAITFTQQSAP
jgi:hypothetical protein